MVGLLWPLLFSSVLVLVLTMSDLVHLRPKELVAVAMANSSTASSGARALASAPQESELEGVGGYMLCPWQLSNADGRSHNSPFLPLLASSNCNIAMTSSEVSVGCSSAPSLKWNCVGTSSCNLALNDVDPTGVACWSQSLWSKVSSLCERAKDLSVQ